MIDLLRSGKLTSEDFITYRVPLERWHEAIRTALDKGSNSIRVMIDHR